MNARVAIVTGSSRGIGFAVAQRLAASGATIVLWDRDEKALAKARAALPPGASVEAFDVANPDAAAKAAEAAARATGRIDVLVCSAGITGPNVPTWEYPIDAWRSVMDVNLNGLFYCNRAVVPVMLKNDYGRIVNIA